MSKRRGILLRQERLQALAALVLSLNLAETDPDVEDLFCTVLIKAQASSRMSHLLRLLRHSQDLQPSPSAVNEAVEEYGGTVQLTTITARIEELARTLDSVRLQAGKIAALGEQFGVLVERANTHQDRIKSLQDDFYQNLLDQSLGQFTGPRHQVLEVAVYVPDYTLAAERLASVVESYFLQELGLEIVVDPPPVIRSFFKRWITRTKDLLTRDEAEELIESAKRALELKVLDQPQASVDKDQAEAAFSVGWLALKLILGSSKFKSCLSALHRTGDGFFDVGPIDGAGQSKLTIPTIGSLRRFKVKYLLRVSIYDQICVMRGHDYLAAAFRLTNLSNNL
jgi:hypothetical protein